MLPTLLEVLNTNFIRDKWPSRDRLAAFVRACEEMPPAVVGKCDYHYRIHIIHVQDDYDIPWSHGEQMLWSAVIATTSKGISFEELEREKEVGKTVLGERGWLFSRETERGVIREDVPKYGLHDKIMGYPIVSVAVMRAFGIDA